MLAEAEQSLYFDVTGAMHCVPIIFGAFRSAQHNSDAYLAMSSSIAENGFNCFPGDSTTAGTVAFTGNEFNLRSSCRFRSSSANCFKDSRTMRAFSGALSFPLMSCRESSLMGFFFGALGTFRSLDTMAEVDVVVPFRIVFGGSARDRSRFLGDNGPA